MWTSISRTDTRFRAALESRADALGFGAVGIASAQGDARLRERLAAFIEAGHHGTMEWLSRDGEKRTAPDILWPDARSAIMLGVNYAPADDPMDALTQKETGTISAYARRRDYHDIIKGRLKQLASWVAAETQGQVKVFVDTAPLMEKPLAEKAGIGWQGKHTNLVSRTYGSWLFLGAILTEAEIAPDAAETDHCGACRACLDICPTNAFPAPYRLDATRCIAYLTIEHHGPIDIEFREAMGNRIFGCDDCLAVCPWNKFARASGDSKLALKPDLAGRPLAEYARLDDAAFRALFAGTPVKRTGRERFVRNVMIAIGNSGDAALGGEAEAGLSDQSPLVRGMAVWALSRLVEPPQWQALKARHRPLERDAQVIEEWDRAA
ncbi:MAG: tRNA epoxyqueuosine(34) reductase QueG [Rhodobiaceae bacterium]|nr:tRNA epoxyqueuosine(34) reductase QueG [Rhodobiaceae bacterium]MCC0055298.1 tRNA epoxyqueuosine(34) reductase QueG [Rhodobiaceae bacterium]